MYQKQANVYMTNKDIKTVVPALRFPEFRDAEGWCIKPLSEILDYERPDNYIVADTNYCKKGTPVLTANKSFVLGYTEENYGIYSNLPAIIFDDFTVDKKYVDFPFKVKSSAIKILKPKNDNNLRFAYELMNCLKFEAIEYKRYYISSYQTQMISSPKPVEQTRIADCLGGLDDLISAVADKIETLKEHKKGLMQQLFPAEGKTTPALRFPEFQKAPEWQETTLGKCLDFEQPTPYLVSDTNYSNDYKTPVLTAGKSFILGYTDETEGIFNHLLPVIIFDDFTTATQFVDFHFKVKSSAMKILRAKNDTDIKFMYEAMKTISYQVGVHERHWISIFSPMMIIIPKPDEQKRIADFLSSVDDLILVVTDKLDQLKAHKKGLKQQLFPTLNE